MYGHVRSCVPVGCYVYFNRLIFIFNKLLSRENYAVFLCRNGQLLDLDVLCVFLIWNNIFKT